MLEIMVVVSLVGMLAGISVPGWVKARDAANLNMIRTNLRMIDDVKAQWALDTRASNSTTPVDADLQGYVRGNQMPKPVVGEIYSINSLQEPASAVIPIPLAGLPAGSTITL